MLQQYQNAIQEVTTGGYVPTTTTGGNYTSQCVDTGYLGQWPYSTVYWHNYPVYVCSDKTKKAIEVLKALQSEKLLKCDSVPRFIELVEKIAGLL